MIRNDTEFILGIDLVSDPIQGIYRVFFISLVMYFKLSNMFNQAHTFELILLTIHARENKAYL